MSGIRTGNFFINSNLDLRTLQLPTDQYRQMRRKSIILALTWLEENVLNRDDAGHHLREKTRNGVTFDDDMNRYLMNSCLHWVKTINGNSRHKPRTNKNRSRPYSSVHHITKSPPDMVERPMTCPGREIKISPIRVDSEPKINCDAIYHPPHTRHNSSRNKSPDRHNSRDYESPDRHNSSRNKSPDRHNSSRNKSTDRHNSRDYKSTDRHNSRDYKSKDRYNSRDYKSKDRYNSRRVQPNRNIKETVSVQSVRAIKTRHHDSLYRENIYRSKTYSPRPHRVKHRTNFRPSILPIRPKVIPKTGVYRKR